MILLDRMLVGGLKFVFGKIATAVDQELNDDSALREQLLAAQMRLELGELSQQEFDAIEADVLVRLREIHERRTGGPSGPIEFKRDGDEALTVDAQFGGDEDDASRR